MTIFVKKKSADNSKEWNSFTVRLMFIFLLSLLFPLKYFWKEFQVAYDDDAKQMNNSNLLNVINCSLMRNLNKKSCRNVKDIWFGFKKLYLFWHFNDIFTFSIIQAIANLCKVQTSKIMGNVTFLTKDKLKPSWRKLFYDVDGKICHATNQNLKIVDGTWVMNNVLTFIAVNDDYQSREFTWLVR